MRDERDRRTGIAGAARAADPMHVGFSVLRQRIIDHVGQVVDVDPARRHVGGYQYIGQLFFESFQDFFALYLRNVAVQSFGRIPAFGQLVDHFVYADLGAAEDDPVKFGFDVDDSR